MSIETSRLILRRWRPEDTAPFAALCADPVVMEYFPATLSFAESSAFIARAEEKFERQGFGFWATALKDSGAFIGFVGLNVPAFEAPFTPCVEIGWRLGKQYWGFGYASEAARACLDFGFRRAGLTEILSWTAVGNQRSRNVMERIGMTRDHGGDFDHPLVTEESPLRRHVLYRATTSGHS
jgi:RimJ/RimL family protein N-acetyltransferase